MNQPKPIMFLDIMDERHHTSNALMHMGEYDQNFDKYDEYETNLMLFVGSVESTLF